MDRRTVYVDIDETLMCHNLSNFPNQNPVLIVHGEDNRQFYAIPHDKNIKLLVKFYLLGYDVILWSKTGAGWAKAVAEVLGIEKYVKTYLSKPDYYLDDKDVTEWMGIRCWRDPINGEE